LALSRVTPVTIDCSNRSVNEDHGQCILKHTKESNGKKSPRLAYTFRLFKTLDTLAAEIWPPLVFGNCAHKPVGFYKAPRNG
jgi:hypothetical protein